MNVLCSRNSEDALSRIVNTPKPPYYAVIFSSLRSDQLEGYREMAARMMELASNQPGFLGVETACEVLGVTVSYWSDLESIKRWKANAEHIEAQRMGMDVWYSSYMTRIALVEQDYSKKL